MKQHTRIHEDNYPMPQIDEDKRYKLTSKIIMISLSIVILTLLLSIFVWVFNLTDYFPER